jgi:hypothetical protein
MVHLNTFNQPDSLHGDYKINGILYNTSLLTEIYEVYE